MIRIRIMTAIAIWIGAVLVSTNAHAYLDPGTGSIVLQALAGGLAGVAFLLKLYWKKLKTLFGRSGTGADHPDKPSEDM